MTIAMMLKLMLLGSAFLIVFALALRASAADALYMFTHPGPEIRALIAMFLVVPVVAIVIALAFDLHPAVKIALVAIALSPLPPILPAKQLKAGAQLSYVTGLLFTASVASIVIAPLGLLLVDRLVPADFGLHIGTIAPPIIIGTALPLVLGVIGHRLLGEERADRIAGPISKAASIVFALVALVLVVMLAPAMWQLVGDGTLIALCGMILAGIAAGYWLAGDDPGDKAALALAASSRHPGIAIAIAAATFPDEKLAPAAILLATLLGIIVGIPFLKRIRTPAGTAA